IVRKPLLPQAMIEMSAELTELRIKYGKEDWRTTKILRSQHVRHHLQALHDNLSKHLMEAKKRGLHPRILKSVDLVLDFTGKLLAQNEIGLSYARFIRLSFIFAQQATLLDPQLDERIRQSHLNMTMDPKFKSDGSIYPPAIIQSPQELMLS